MKFIFYICLWVSVSIFAQIISAQSDSNYDWINHGYYFGRVNFLINAGLKIDSRGNLINTGSYSDFTDFLFIHKISSSGDLIWKLDNFTRERHEGKILDLIVDEKDNIYVTGFYFTVSPLTEDDTLFVQKVVSINDTPKIEWEYRHIIGDDYANIEQRQFILEKYDSTLVITGITLNRNSLADMTTIKLDTNGTELWKRYFKNDDNYDVSPKNVAVDNDGNIFVLGNSVKDDSSTVQLIKYSSTGNLLWNKTIMNPDNPNISAVDIEINDESAWISANSNGKIFLFKYDSLGNKIWEIIRKTTSVNLGLSVDKAENVYQVNTDSIFKFNSTGNFLSSVELPSLTNVLYSYFDVDEEQNIYVVGNRDHFYTAKINSSLEIESAFETTWQEPLNQHYVGSSPFAIAASSTFGLFISGQLDIYDSLNFNSYKEQVTIKYSGLPTKVKGIDFKPSSFKLSQNYPNPFNPTTRIKYTIPQNTHPSIPSREGKERSDRGVFVTLKVYDVLGKEVATLVNKEQSAGSYEVEFRSDGLTSGVYFYRLQVSPSSSSGQGFVETKKMLLLR